MVEQRKQKTCSEGALVSSSVSVWRVQPEQATSGPALVRLSDIFGEMGSSFRELHNQQEASRNQNGT